MGYYKGKPINKDSTPSEKTKYTEQLISITKMTGRDQFSHVVYANRQFTSNSYQFIQAEIMKKLIENETSSTFTNPKGKSILEKDIASIAN